MVVYKHTIRLLEIKHWIGKEYEEVLGGVPSFNCGIVVVVTLWTLFMYMDEHVPHVCSFLNYNTFNVLPSISQLSQTHVTYSLNYK